MNTRDLIDAVVTGNSQQFQQSFEAEMSSRIVDRLDVMRQAVAQSMFKSDDADFNEETETE